jgi:hypothetical protein
MKNYDKPFNFPENLLRQLEECSSNGAFLLFYKDTDNCIIPVMNCEGQSDALALCSFAHNYLTALNNIDVNSLIDMFRHSINEHMGVDEEGEDDDQD